MPTTGVTATEYAYYRGYGIRRMPAAGVTAYEYAYYRGYGIRSVPTTGVTAYGVCLLPGLRHTEYAYYLGVQGGF